jgi:hypothetical protein
MFRQDFRSICDPPNGRFPGTSINSAESTATSGFASAWRKHAWAEKRDRAHYCFAQFTNGVCVGANGKDAAV